jgi:hypothetical protein
VISFSLFIKTLCVFVVIFIIQCDALLCMTSNANIFETCVGCLLPWPPSDCLVQIFCLLRETYTPICKWEKGVILFDHCAVTITRLSH